MAEFSQGHDPNNGPSQTSSIPQYHVTRRADLSLAFDPPIGSRELANALSMKFPLCENLEQQLQSAILDFISTEPDDSQQHTFTPPQNIRQSLSSVNDSVITAEPEAPKTPKSSPKSDFEASTSVWSVTTGRLVAGLDKKRKRIKYDRAKRFKVAGVRRSGACDYHRKKKTECTCNTSPVSNTSPMNGQRSYARTIDTCIEDTAVKSSFAGQSTFGISASATEVTGVMNACDTTSFATNLTQLHNFDFEVNFSYWNPIDDPQASSASIPRSTMSMTDTSHFDIPTPIDAWVLDNPEQPNNFW